MKYASALRPFFAFAIVASPFVVVACSTPDTHPPIIGDCSGANCIAGGSPAGASTSTNGDSSTPDSSTIADSGIDADDGSAVGSE